MRPSLMSGKTGRAAGEVDELVVLDAHRLGVVAGAGAARGIADPDRRVGGYVAVAVDLLGVAGSHDDRVALDVERLGERHLGAAVRLDVDRGRHEIEAPLLEAGKQAAEGGDPAVDLLDAHRGEDVAQDLDVDAGELALGRGVAERVLVGEPHPDVALILDPLERALGAGGGRVDCRQPDTGKTCHKAQHHRPTSHPISVHQRLAKLSVGTPPTRMARPAPGRSVADRRQGLVIFTKLGNSRFNLTICHFVAPFGLLSSKKGSSQAAELLSVNQFIVQKGRTGVDDGGGAPAAKARGSAERGRLRSRPTPGSYRSWRSRFPTGTVGSGSAITVGKVRILSPRSQARHVTRPSAADKLPGTDPCAGPAHARARRQRRSQIPAGHPARYQHHRRTAWRARL